MSLEEVAFKHYTRLAATRTYVYHYVTASRENHTEPTIDDLIETLEQECSTARKKWINIIERATDE